MYLSKVNTPVFIKWNQGKNKMFIRNDRFKYYFTVLLLCSFIILSLSACTSQKEFIQDDTRKNKNLYSPESYTLSDELKELMKHGMILEREGKFDEAKLMYDRVVVSAPNFADAYARLGFTLQKMGYAKEASEMFSKCEEKGAPSESEYIPEIFMGTIINNSVWISSPPKNESELIKYRVATRCLIFSEPSSLCLVMQYENDSVPINAQDECMIGIGSELRFDKKDWVDFIGGKYRDGGVSITEKGVSFWEGTERLDGNKVYIFVNGKWTSQ